MSESAEALAASQTSRRNVTIEITNLTVTYCLLDPRIYLESGHCHSPPQPTVRPMKTEVCNFTKTSGKASGAVGVLTYDLFKRDRGTSETLAIMFSVPYDYGVYKNWMAVGLVSKDTATNEDLYKKMYYDKEDNTICTRAECNGSGITFKGRNMDIKATMSPLGRSIMKVEIWDKLFSPLMHQSY